MSKTAVLEADLMEQQGTGSAPVSKASLWTGRVLSGLVLLFPVLDGVIKLPGQQYAVFPHCGHVPMLRDRLDTLRHKWFPVSGHEAVQPAAGAPAFFERYGKDFNPQTGMGDVEVWMPIKS